MRNSLPVAGASLVFSAASLLSFAPRAIAETRPRLQILNGSDQALDVYWLEHEGERRHVATIPPRSEGVVDTTIGHRFIVAGQKDQVEAEVVSRVPVQAFRFDPQGKEGVPAFYT